MIGALAAAFTVAAALARQMRPTYRRSHSRGLPTTGTSHAVPARPHRDAGRAADAPQRTADGGCEPRLLARPPHADVAPDRPAAVGGSSPASAAASEVAPRAARSRYTRRCPRPSSSARSGATRARARSSTCSPRTRISSAATRAARTRAHDRRRRRDVQDPRAPERDRRAARSCVIGNGCVVDPEVLIAELDEFERARALDRARLRLRQRAPDHAVAHRDRQRERAAARQARDRHDAPRHRAVLRRQGGAARDPRAGHARPEDPAPEDRGRARREEPLARARLRDEAVRARGGRGAATRSTRSGCGRTSPTRRCSSTARSRTASTVLLRGRAGDAARPRPRHVSVRHVVEPGRGERRDGRRDRRRSGSTA